MWKLSMFQLQELVRLHRMGVGCHEVARLLGVSPNTERPNRLALAQAGLLDGPAESLPEESALKKEALLRHRGRGKAPEQLSSVSPWLGHIQPWAEAGAQPTAI